MFCSPAQPGPAAKEPVFRQLRRRHSTQARQRVIHVGDKDHLVSRQHDGHQLRRRLAFDDCAIESAGEHLGPDCRRRLHRERQPDRWMAG